MATNDTTSTSSKSVKSSSKFALDPEFLKKEKIVIMHRRNRARTLCVTVAYKWAKPDGDDSFRHVAFGAAVFHQGKPRTGMTKGKTNVKEAPYDRQALNHTAVSRLMKHPVHVDVPFTYVTDKDGTVNMSKSLKKFEDNIRQMVVTHGVRAGKSTANDDSVSDDGSVAPVGDDDGSVVPEVTAVTAQLAQTTVA